MAQKAVVVLIILGAVCIMASQVIKPSAVIPYPRSFYGLLARSSSLPRSY